jgi:hypothetical protein
VNVSIFYVNLEAINKLLTSTDIVAKYTALVPLIVAYRQSPGITAKDELDAAILTLSESLDEIVEGLSKIPHSSLLVKELHADHLVGFFAEPLNQVIYNDLFTAHERIQQIATDTQTFQTTIANLVANLNSLQYETDKELATNLFTIEFAGSTEIKSLDDLMAYAKKIELILYNYACLSENGAEFAPVIQSISKDSPVTIDISWTVDNIPTILNLIGLTVLFYLRKKDESLKNIELEQLVIQQVPKDRMPKKLKDGLTELKDGVLDQKAIESHVDELIKSIKTKPADRTPDEQKGFLLKGAQDLIELLENGARVEVYKADEATEDTATSDSATQTTIIYTKYKQIEQKSSQLNAGLTLKLPKNTAEDEQEPRAI